MKRSKTINAKGKAKKGNILRPISSDDIPITDRQLF